MVTIIGLKTKGMLFYHNKDIIEEAVKKFIKKEDGVYVILSI